MIICCGRFTICEAFRESWLSLRSYLENNCCRDLRSGVILS